MLFEGQYDAVGDDGTEDQVLKWSGWVKEKYQNNNKHNKFKNILKRKTVQKK